MASLLTQHLPPTRSGRTFFIALAVLGLGALAQFAVLGVYLWRGGIAARRATIAAPVALHFSETLPPDPAVSNASTALPAPVPTPAPAAQDAPTGPTIARPTPAGAAPNPAGAGDLLEQARGLRLRGDTRTALARLREAQVAEPDNPPIIAEMALTFEAMQVPERAAEQWQRLFDLGEGVGALHALADVRLHSLPGNPGAANPLAAFTAGSGAPDAAGVMLKLEHIQREDTEDAAAEQKFDLKIVVKGRPGAAIDPQKVVLRVYFYDLLDGKDVVLTNAQTAYAWVTPAPIDWANDKSETLEATYLRPKAAPAPDATVATPTPNPGKGKSRRSRLAVAEATPAPSATPAPVRVFAGYMVRLYYDRQLQDVQADPPRLLSQFPAPATLTGE